MIFAPDGTPVHGPVIPEPGSPASTPVCKQCGTCCRKGGPAMHGADSAMFAELLHASDLCSFRAGELVRDEAEGIIVPLPAELVKIAPPEGSRPDDWTCRFLTSANACFLHGHHPAECRALFCQAPEALMALSGEDRLDRKAVRALLQAPDWWDELIDAHEERCQYEGLTDLASRLDKDDNARREFLEVVEYDRSFRDLVVEKKAALPGELNFLFGRPLLRTVIMYGLDARTAADGRISLVQTSKAAMTCL